MHRLLEKIVWRLKVSWMNHLWTKEKPNKVIQATLQAGWFRRSALGRLSRYCDQFTHYGAR